MLHVKYWMPRLTDKQYLKYRKFLRRLWLQHKEAYSHLTPNQQWQIHEYFRPSEELTNEQLLEHRKDITIQHPSLPHQVGRNIKEFGQILRSKSKSRATVSKYTNKRGQTRNIRVRSIVRPKIDTRRLARALIELDRES
jgi:hypothetical protein